MDSVYLEPVGNVPSTLVWKRDQSSQTFWTTHWLNKDDSLREEFCKKSRIAPSISQRYILSIIPFLPLVKIVSKSLFRRNFKYIFLF